MPMSGSVALSMNMKLGENWQRVGQNKTSAGRHSQTAKRKGNIIRSNEIAIAQNCQPELCHSSRGKHEISKPRQRRSKQQGLIIGREKKWLGLNLTDLSESKF